MRCVILAFSILVLLIRGETASLLNGATCPVDCWVGMFDWPNAIDPNALMAETWTFAAEINPYLLYNLAGV